MMPDRSRPARAKGLALVLGTVLVLALPGCDLVTGVDEERHIGAIGYPDDLSISVPDAVKAGAPFAVVIRTFGPDGCWRHDGTDVDVDGLTATLTPYDVDRQVRGVACTMAIVEILHLATVTFEQPGAARVEVRGRDGTAVVDVVVGE